MTSKTQTYNEAVELLNEFASADKIIYDGIISDDNITYALGILEDNSGIIRADYKLAKLCADSFMFGVFIATKRSKGAITLSEQEQAVKCLNCEFIDSKNGRFKCRLAKCKYE
jgi:hypothetical protein